MQRVLYLFLSLFIFFAPVPPVLAGTATAFSDQFADLKSHPWGAAELTMMVQLGIMQGYPEGDRLYALPDKQVNRAEFAALLARTLSLGDGQEIPPFTDWQAVPDWARGPAAALYEAGIVTGVPRPDGALIFYPRRRSAVRRLQPCSPGLWKMKCSRIPSTPLGMYGQATGITNPC